MAPRKHENRETWYHVPVSKIKRNPSVEIESAQYLALKAKALDILRGEGRTVTIKELVGAAVGLYLGMAVPPPRTDGARAGSSDGTERNPPKVEVAGSSPAPPALPSLDDLVRSGAVRTLPGESRAIPADGRWMLEGQYSDASGQHTTPFFKIVEDGVVRWEDYDKEDLPAEIVTMLEIELSCAKPKVRLKEVQE